MDSFANSLKYFNSSSMEPSSSGTALFHYHVGSLYGLAVAARRLCATVGDDKQLMLWDVVDCELLAKKTLKVTDPVHSIIKGLLKQFLNA